MALSPKYAGLATKVSGGEAVHTIELFLDYVCPYSAKMWKTLTTSTPSILTSSKNVRFIFRPQIQPWHPSSTLCVEASIAILHLNPTKFLDFSTALMTKQKEYFDVNVVNETRNETYKRLAALAEESTGIEKDKVYEMLVISDKPGKDGGLNGGNKVTNDVKFLVKGNRQQSVHVTPTVFFNGVQENYISSSFTAQQWEEWLQKNAV